MDVHVAGSAGNDKIIFNLEHLGHSTRNGVRKALYRIGKDISRIAKRSIIEGPKTGRLYRIKGRKNLHRASAPGEPPANLKGNLQKSVGFIVQGQELIVGAGGPDGQSHGNANIDVDYAKRLEKGDARVAARPFLLKAIMKRQGQTQNEFESEIKKNLESGS